MASVEEAVVRHAAAVAPELDAHMARIRVLLDVVQRFLRDTEQIELLRLVEVERLVGVAPHVQVVA